MPIRDIDMLSGIYNGAGRGGEGSGGGGGGGPDRDLDPATRGGQSWGERNRRRGECRGWLRGWIGTVTLLIGDVSFQHDANGLRLLRERPGQPP